MTTVKLATAQDIVDLFQPKVMRDRITLAYAVLQQHGLPAELHENGLGVWLEVPGRHCLVHIQSRPPYCDRGAYVMNVDLKFGCTAKDMTVDWADGFPRYYFSPESLATEVKAWMEARNQLEPEHASENLQEERRIP